VLRRESKWLLLILVLILILLPLVLLVLFEKLFLTTVENARKEFVGVYT